MGIYLSLEMIASLIMRAINGKQNVTKISTDSQTSFYEMKLVSVNTHKLETSELLKNFVEMFKNV